MAVGALGFLAGSERVWRSIIFCAVALGWASVGAASEIQIVVNNTSDRSDVAGSLPWAVDRARDEGRKGNSVTISFNISGGGGHTIGLLAPLFIDYTTKIIGESQPGYSGSPLIRIDVRGRDSSFIVLGGNGNVISGLNIINFSRNAIATQPGAGKTIIANNYIGFYWDGAANRWWRNFEADIANWNISDRFVRAPGIGLQSSHNVVENNVISGVHNGISIGYDPALPMGPPNVGNVIRGNRIGVTPDGKAILANDDCAYSYRPDPNSDPFGDPDKWKCFGNNSDGIYLAALARDSIIVGNVSSGNYSAGAELFHETVDGNHVDGNHFGVDVSGVIQLPNGELGMILSNGAHHNYVGTSEGNVFSGNRYAGIELGGENSGRKATWNFVKGNVVGCNKERSALVGNQDVGIHIGSYEAADNLIEGNVVCGNKWGIYLDKTNSQTLIGNYVGVTNKRVAVGPYNDGIVIDRSYHSRVINNTVMYSGWGNRKHGDWGKGIWKLNGSRDIVAGGNELSNNKNKSNVKAVKIPGAAYVDGFLGVSVVCVNQGGNKVRFHLDRVEVHDGASDSIYWKLDPDSVGKAVGVKPCLAVGAAGGLSVDGAYYNGAKVSFTINPYLNQDDPSGNYFVTTPNPF